MSTALSGLIDAIVAYLTHNPQAADSVEGVARWWLAGLSHMVSHEQVEHALDTMVKSGWLRRVELPDGSVIYGRDGTALH